jgi:hypothetical protein
MTASATFWFTTKTFPETSGGLLVSDQNLPRDVGDLLVSDQNLLRQAAEPFKHLQKPFLQGSREAINY